MPNSNDDSLSPKAHHGRRLIAGILLVALALRISAAVYWHHSASAEEHFFRVGDSYSYWTLATQLGQGLPYQYGSENASIFRAPLYPILLVPFTWIPDTSTAVFAARCLGCLLGTLAVALLGTLASRLGGRRAAVAAMGIAAVYPSAIGMSITVLSEALFMPLMLGHLLLWTKAFDSNRTVQLSVIAGGLAGLAILARPSWLLFLPFSLALLGILSSDRKRHATVLLCSAVGIAVIMCPWWIRNASITGRFVPTTLQVGPSLFDGLHPGATGASDEGMLFMQDILAQQLEADKTATRPPPSTLEWRLNKRATKLAIDWATSHPIETAKLAFAKFRKTWSLWPGGGENSSWLVRIAITISSFSILLAAIGGTHRTLSRGDAPKWRVFTLWLPCLYFTLLHMVFVGSVRYREPAVFVLIALAACLVSRWDKTRRT